MSNSNAMGSGSSLSASVSWTAHLLTGTLGTSIAILSIAWVGFAMLQGKLAIQRCVRAVVGSFILFGAPVIASALANLAYAAKEAVPAQPVIPSSIAPPPPSPAPNYDPYAGASVSM
jgi:type IV secretory pathway VirB2 component (pilin)